MDEQKRELQKQVKSDIVDLIYRQSVGALLMTVISASILASIIWDNADHLSVVIWLISVFTSIIFRGIIFALYFKNNPQGVNREKWEIPFAVGVLISAAVWSIGITIIAIDLALTDQIAVFFFQMGMAAGAISVFGAIRYIALSTVAIMLVPAGLLFAFSGETFQTLIAVGASLFLISTIRSTKILANTLNDVFNLTYNLSDQAVKLEIARQSAELAKNTRGQFIASLSHEIRTPLNVILGMIELLRGRFQDPQNDHYYKSLDSASKHLSSLVDNVLDFSKIDEDKNVLSVRTVNLLEVVQDVVDVFSDQAKTKGITLTLSSSNLTKSTWLADQQRLRQILFNLVSNAIKYSDSGEVTLSVYSKDEGVEFSVTDAGKGIPKEQILHIFDPYFQYPHQKLDQLSSTGLGLSICKKLAHQMGGDLNVESVVGVGSIFTIYLPLMHSESVKPQKMIEPDPDTHTVESIPDLSGKKILVAEDSPLNQQLIRDFVEGTNLQLIFTANGQETLSVLEHESVDLLLLDLQMEVMGGLELINRIRAQEEKSDLPSTPIIIQTADNRRESRLACLDAGANRFLAKPFSRKRLVSEIIEALEGNPKPCLDGSEQMDPSLIRLFPRFLEGTDDSLIKINSALAAQDLAQASKTTHEVKGYCGMFKQDDLFQLAGLIENHCEQGELASAKNLLNEFEILFNELKANYK
ncbi:Autoinducer 2 sensor kinase/phosphatase LuxQ [Marinobacterium sp. xm-d-420]|nr:Autoinducer 2 sensor kinase/phosphatase LuxQ [Marinobacterium sp. xm-d-420]